LDNELRELVGVLEEVANALDRTPRYTRKLADPLHQNEEDTFIEISDKAANRISRLIRQFVEEYWEENDG
jgi:hypothetical protein